MWTWAMMTITDDPDANNIVFMEEEDRDDGSTISLGWIIVSSNGDYVVYSVSSAGAG